jgi:predicted glycosyltransferase involved in capsule biosynthesis
VFFRRAGLHSEHIKLWEDEILAMGKKEMDKSDYIKNLEEENKKLNKKLKELERDKKELQVLIELKKKYPTLFKGDGED